MSTGLPVVDLAPLGEGRGGVTTVARNLDTALAHSGFFYATGHGLAPALTRGILDATRRFYALPLEARQAVAVDERNRGWMALGQATMYGARRPDRKEVFFFGPEVLADDPRVRAGIPLLGPNRWPPAMPELRGAVWAYAEATLGVGRRILGAVAASLGLSPDFFDSRYRAPLGRGQLLLYPPVAADAPDDELGVSPHTDFGCLTLVLQDGSGGLEVRGKNGAWIPVPPREGTLVVNVGDLLARWSNDRLPSTVHRVRHRSAQRRHSVAIFCDPDPEAVIDPRDMRLPAAVVPRYDPVTVAGYILERNRGVFSHYARAGDRPAPDGVAPPSG